MNTPLASLTGTCITITQLRFLLMKIIQFCFKTGRINHNQIRQMKKMAKIGVCAFLRVFENRKKCMNEQI